MNCLLCAREISGKEDSVACGTCGKIFHAKCMDITSTELKFLRDNKTSLRCPICSQAGRKLRSGSTTSTACDSASSASSASILPDHVNTILEELRSIKATQINIVGDIATIKESQAKLANDINAKCAHLQSAVEECRVTLDAHTGALTAHEINISDISERIARLEEKMAEMSTTSGGDSPPPASKSTLDAAIEEISERERRKFNIIIFKMPESTEVDSLQRKAQDTSVVAELFASILCSEVDCRELKVHRIGSRSIGKDRPVRVVLQSEEEVRKILSHARNAKSKNRFRDFIVSSDKTPRQQSQYQDLKRQLSERLKNGEKNLKIRYVSGVPKIVNLN